MSSMLRATAGDQDHQLNLTGTSEDGCGTALTMQKKKARRVSFAETTSVHFFDRDEETPPEPLAKAGEGNGFQVNELNFHQLDNLRSDDDGDEEEDGNASDEDEDGEPALGRSFLRPMESPSPGSTFGSATSNTEDQFFGPVSPSFIRPGRLSDLAVSDDNHEITMDSTAFSMHFRSLARSEVGVNLKTPPGTHLFDEEKTPECTQGNSMVLTVTKKPISNSSLPVVNASGKSDSSDMSLIGEHSQEYDYGRLSPDLNALLAEGQYQIDMFSLSDNISASALPRNKKSDYLAAKENESCTMGLDESCKHNVGAAALHNMPSDLGYAHAPLDSSVSPSNPTDSGISVDSEALISNKLSKDKVVGNSMGASTDAFEDWRSKKLSSLNNDSPLSLHIPKDIPHQLRSPLTGAVSPSPIWRSPMHAVNNAQKYHSMVICSQKDPFIEKENMGSQVSSASIQKSISKLERLRASTFSSALGDGMHDLPVISLDFTKTPPLNSNMGKVNAKQVKEKSVSAPSMFEDDQFSNIVQIEGQKKHTLSKDGNGLKALAHDEGKMHSPLISEDPKEILFTSVRDSLPAECVGEKQASTTPCINFSPAKSLEKLSSSFQDNLFSPGRKPRFLGGSTNISGHKRKNELLIEHRDSQDAIVTLQGSPKLQKYQGQDISKCPDETCSGKPSEHINWADVKSKFMESADKWSFLPTEKLNEYGIDVLQEFMNRMHKSKKYELLHHGLLSQKKSAHQNLLEKRTAELQLLLCRVVHEKAKLHLMRVKQEKLQEKFHFVCSGIQECITLKFNSLPQLSATYAKGLQPDASLQTSLVNLNGMPEVVRDKVSTMAQSLEVSDMKITNLIKYFNSTIKTKDELNCNDTIAFVKEFLVKRKRCRFFHQEMQMFDIQSIRSSPGHHILVLNYLGILVQSLNMATGSTSSITIINKLDNSAITKNFRNMDAYTAFSFVLEDEISRKLVGARSLAQEIQVTQSLLGNLIDVVQEAQLARRELHNLIDTRFCSSNDGELDLQLSFVSPKSGIKVKATLVVSSLKRGIYPSESIPSVGAARADGTKCNDEAFVWGIDNAVKSVKPGHFRIIRLCRSISKAI